MKALKLIAIVTALMLLCGGAYTFYLLRTARVEIVDIRSSGLSASEDEDGFSALVNSVKDGSFIGTLYQTPAEWKQAEDYAVVSYTVTLKNSGLLPIDMIELQVVPLSSDILQFGNEGIQSLNEKPQGEYTASILAAKDSHMMREIIVTYYVWGISFSLRAASGS